MTSVFLLENPTHYVNAAEYIFQQGEPREECYLLVITQYYDQIIAVNENIGPLNWKKEIVHEYNPLVMDPASIAAKRLAFREGSRFLKSINFDTMVLGNIGSDLLFAFALVFGRDKKIIVLDDGAPTLNHMSIRRLSEDFRRWHVGTLKRLLKSVFAYQLFFPFYSSIPKLTFFTTYEAECVPKDSLIVNNQSLLVQLASKATLSEDFAWFIGSSWVEKGIIAEETLFSILGSLLKTREGVKFLYIAHRNENSEKLNRINELCEVVHFKVPIEIAICTSERSPASLFSIYTSALPNICDLPINIKTYAVELTKQDVLSSSPESYKYISAFYHFMSKKSIQVISSPQIP